ncbi:phage-related regulatory protein [Hyphomonas oceanitis SCH89]|uniref:Phage-related regulatory protein n=2 Tax=Hyphomonas oceanitis TaxID=81033 RepID=A0A059G9R4_9PROT|nr:phage-related regulatory protein [Hyphomonas oceanitis SCH89]
MPIRRSESFGLDVILGDPRLALIEDFFAREWASSKSGDIRGIKSSLAFAEILSKLQSYDFVLIDVSPSLGAINRAILLSSKYFVSPMSIDIFSLRAFENITEWLKDWRDDWDAALSNVKAGERNKIPELDHGNAKFLGYVTQQYLAKTDSSGHRRAVNAYEKIQSRIDSVIDECFTDQELVEPPYKIGTVPNLFSLIPMSQSSHKPVFELLGKDGVVGAHFAKVQDSKKTFGRVAKQLVKLVDND